LVQDGLAKMKKRERSKDVKKMVTDVITFG